MTVSTVVLICGVCGAKVIHTDRVSLADVSAYLSAAGWLMTSATPSSPQATFCPRCAPLAEITSSQPQPALQEAAHS